MKKTVNRFSIQPTQTYPEGAPQREEYVTVRGFIAACIEYGAEWRREYECGDKNCRNPDCPQHGYSPEQIHKTCMALDAMERA